MIDRGSAKAVAASGNGTPCFFSFEDAFGAFQSKWSKDYHPPKNTREPQTAAANASGISCAASSREDFSQEPFRASFTRLLARTPGRLDPVQKAKV